MDHLPDPVFAPEFTPSEFIPSEPGQPEHPEPAASAETPAIYALPEPAAAASDAFLDLLADLERNPVAGDRSPVIARYQAWISRNSGASPALYAAWFNLGVELAEAGDKAAAMDAYRNTLALRPNFYPAALNLGTLMEAAGQPDIALAIWQQALQSDESRAALQQHRDRLLEACRVEQQNAAAVLHVGCGAYAREKLPAVFSGAGWREIRLDIDPDVQPDFVASITDMNVIADGAVDAVYSSHNIEHLYPHDVPLALKEMHRVLKPNGFTFLKLPDLQEVARHVAGGRLEDPLYMSGMGPIAPLDIMFGHRASLAAGNLFMAHRTGFTSGTLGAALIRAGFAAAMVQRDTNAFALAAVAFRNHPDAEQLAKAQGQMLPVAEHPAVLYAAAAG
jgi:SAM-dependent methyltransferase